MIQERLDEFIFHRTYLRDQPFNTWIILKLLAKYGRRAAEFVATDKPPKKNMTEEERIKERDRFYYRAEEIQTQSDDEQMESKEDTDEKEQDVQDLARTEVDEFGNLVEYNEYGHITNVWYRDPTEQAQANDTRRQYEQEQQPPNSNDSNSAQEMIDIQQNDPQLYLQLRQHVNRNR